MAIYLDDLDRDKFLELLAQSIESHRVVCHAYCMMTNHYHVVLTTMEANLSDAVKQVNGPYAQWWNRRHARAGHVFQARFHARLVQDDTYLLTVCKYVVRNPVKGHLVHAPEQWPWSSYCATAGLAALPSFLRPDDIWQRLGGGDVQTRVLRYREFIAACDGGEPDLPDDPVLGDAAFVDRFRNWHECASREVPRRARRPPLEILFAGAVTRAALSAQAAAAHAFGYTVVELAGYLDLHYSTVSKMIAVGRGPGREITGSSRPDPAAQDDSAAARGQVVK
jgi:REP element-mobilizing transposase RayT